MGHSHTHTKKEKKAKAGILLVAFGTSVPEAKKALVNIDIQMQKAFPETEIRWAYTSKIIRRKLKKQGEVLFSPAEALTAMEEEGFTNIFVQSLHIIPGFEYWELEKIVKAFDGIPKSAPKVVIGEPLLSKHEDIEKASDALMLNLPPDRKADEAVVFVGHGTHHAANIYYPGMQYYLWRRDPNVFMGTVEGYPEIDDIIPLLEEKQIKKVWLQPFMAVAGDHAKNDIAGAEEDSWLSILQSKGYEVEAYLKGSAEFNEIVQIWIDHLHGLIEHES